MFGTAGPQADLKVRLYRLPATGYPLPANGYPLSQLEIGGDRELGFDDGG